jgi:Transposase.
MPSYSKELKEKIIEKMLTDRNTSIAELSRETGLHENTLRRWKSNGLQKGLSQSTNCKTADKWSSQDKFIIVLETAAMSQVELSEYCRKKGLYPEQVKAWKDACIQANGGVAEEAARLNQELKKKEQENKKISKELDRKEKALAEAAALLVLRKNADAIWGDKEEE